MKSGFKRRAVFAKPFDDEDRSLRDDTGGLEERDEGEEYDAEDDKIFRCQHGRAHGVRSLDLGLRTLEKT